jgi:hypothetical protein
MRALVAEVLARGDASAPAAASMHALAARFESQPGAGAPSSDAAELERSASYLLAMLDADLFQLPDPTSGYRLAQARIGAHHRDVRRLALVVLALAAVSLALLLVQRGLAGSAQAEDVLRASGLGWEDRSRARLRRTLRVLGVAVSMLLAFLAIALYLIARGNGP